LLREEQYFYKQKGFREAMSSTTKKKDSTAKKKAETQATSYKEKKVSKKSKEEVKPFYIDLIGVDFLKKTLPIFLILFLMFFAFFIRSGPIELVGIDERVEENFDANLRNIIAREVSSEFGNLNPVYQEELIEKRLSETKSSGYLTLNGERVNLDESLEQSISSSKAGLKADNGQTYLLAIDPYHFLRLSYNYYQNGHTGNTVIEENGEQVPYIDYKLAPNGIKAETDPEFHIWLEAMIFKMAGVESYDIPKLTSLVFLIPVIVSMLSMIPIFLITREITQSDYYATGAALVLASFGTFVSRTIAGFVDTDAYIVLFPLCIAACLVFGVLYQQRKVLSSILLLFSGIFTVFFLWAWDSGWYIFVFASLSLLTYSAYLLTLFFLKKAKDKEIKKELIQSLQHFGIYLLSSFLLCLVFLKINIINKSYISLTSSLQIIADISTENIWPNVLSSVAELNTSSFIGIINSVGGKAMFIIALVGIFALTLPYKTEGKQDKKILLGLISFGVFWFFLMVGAQFFVSLTANYLEFFLIFLFLPMGLGLFYSLYKGESKRELFFAIFLSAWLAGTLFMTFNGIRFLLLVAPVFSIAFALGLFFIAMFIQKVLENEMSLSKEISRYSSMFIIGVLFLFLFLPQATSAIEYSKGVFPGFDDSWYDSMEEIRTISEEDAIISSWWDFGHFFATVGQRGVLFDGASQETPQAHWVGRLLLEDNETVSRDILYMLSCGGNNAFDYMYEVSEDPTRGVWTNQLLSNTFGKNKEEKRVILENYEHYNFSEEEINKAMAELACENPPENYLVTSEDMVGKGAVWAHWGSWNFTRKYVLDSYEKQTAEEIASQLKANESEITQLVKELEEIDERSRLESIKRKDLVNQWLAPYPSYLNLQGGNSVPCTLNNNTYFCLNGQIKFNALSGDLSTNNFGATIRTYSFPVAQPSPRLIQQQIEAEGQVDLLFLPNQGSLSLVIAQAPQGSSLFTRLFFYDGIGSEHFELVSNREGMLSNRVMIWKVNFDEE
jgi:dolichyl-diphosphooligosaccharide--protein glycosyltransferase